MKITLGKFKISLSDEAVRRAGTKDKFISDVTPGFPKDLQAVPELKDELGKVYDTVMKSDKSEEAPAKTSKKE